MKKTSFAVIIAIAISTAGVAAADHPHPAPETDPNVFVVKDAHVQRLLVPRGYLGVSTTHLSSDLLDHFGVDGNNGVMISSIAEDSPASRSELQIGDIVTHVADEEIASSSDLARVIGRLDPDTATELTVVRGGRERTINVTVGEADRRQVFVNWTGDSEQKLVEILEGNTGEHGFSFRFGQDDEDNIFVHGTPMLEAIDALRARVEAPEFQKRIESFAIRNKDLEERLLEMEAQIEELGDRLAEALAKLQQSATN